MNLSDRVQSVGLLKSTWKWPIITLLVLGVSGGIIYKTEFLAGSWGIGASTSVTTKVTKNPQGVVIQETETIEPHAGKSIWDGLSLLGVPLSLALLGAWFKNAQHKQATNDAKEKVLQTYLDRISDLLVDNNLMTIATGKKSKPEDEDLLEVALDIIRARTLAILRQFNDDLVRKSSVISFLAEAEIVSKLQLNLKDAQLDGVELTEISLQKAQLEAVSFKNAHLEKAHFEGANLRKAQFERANLKDAYFQDAHLNGANFRFANLEDAHLYNARLEGAHLEGANLTNARLKEATFDYSDLKGANLQEVHLQGAHLKDVNLENANLRGANLQDADLDRVNLKNIQFDDKTVWPDKSKMATANNISDDLKVRLDLIDSSLSKDLTV